MAKPRVPGGQGDEVELPCGETVAPRDLDMGMREYRCGCGAAHAVVMDVHPPSRFLPEGIVSVLRETVEVAAGDEYGEFGTPHLMASVTEEYPSAVVSADVSGDAAIGYATVWVADFDSRRLHELVVELTVELMEHAVGHADDEAAATEFERRMVEFDVGEFVEQYRAERDFADEHDSPA